MVYPPSGPFQQALDKVPLMRVAYRIGLFIRNFMPNEQYISTGLFLQRQEEIFNDYCFTETFEVIMLLFMLSRYDYLEHIDREKGYRVTDKLIQEFPIIDEWREEYTSYDQLLDQLHLRDRFLDILFRRRTWLISGEFVSLDLSDLLIAELDEEIFQPFHQIKQLYLNNNLLGTLPGSIFEPLPKLEKLDLSTNIISRLPIHIFSSNSHLQSINLARNGIDNRWLLKFKALNRLAHGDIEIIL